jgi:hypothetical protein
MKQVASSVIAAVGIVMWFGGANRLLWPHRIYSRRIFGRRWPVLVNWLALSRREWLRLFVLAIASLVLTLFGLSLRLPN